MTRKVLMLLCAFFLLTVCAQAESVIYGGGQFIVKGGTTEEVGAGSCTRYGQVVSDSTYPRLILWGTYAAEKTGEGDEIDNGFIGFSLMSDHLVPALRAGLYITMEGGFGKIEDERVSFASLTNAGFYFDLSKKTTLWMGGGYTNTKDVSLYSGHVGLSFNVDWK